MLTAAFLILALGQASAGEPQPVPSPAVEQAAPAAEPAAAGEAASLLGALTGQILDMTRVTRMPTTHPKITSSTLCTPCSMPVSLE